MKKYTLVALDKEDDGIHYEGNTIKECLEQFDNRHSRKGFMIKIYKNNEQYLWRETKDGYEDNSIIIKKTYR